MKTKTLNCRKVKISDKLSITIFYKCKKNGGIKQKKIICIYKDTESITLKPKSTEWKVIRELYNAWFNASTLKYTPNEKYPNTNSKYKFEYVDDYIKNHSSYFEDDESVNINEEENLDEN